ncbi:MAG: hypothetical protein QOI24_1352 [Acidobacteriota bacterium]|jgi:photosystem II stability/assembly factor-like uncharacterized protein|nr:hypothetical protein [Acidobacteriota bacterium]
MPVTQQIDAQRGDVLILVGTMKGAFILVADAARRTWELGGPYFPGSAVYAIGYDGRADRHRLWAAASSMHWGSLLHSSDDFGRNWTNPEEATVKFPQGTGAALAQIWQVIPGRDFEPDTMYCGVEPAALFVSRDAGETWSLDEGLWNHPHRERWMPGGGGLCLHTILPDPIEPQRIRIAVSTAGMYVTEDGGASWRASNSGVRADFLPDKHPEFGQCVHKVAQSQQRPERMFLQNHWGLYRTDDRGENWVDIANGVPSDFGFPVAIHPRDADRAWIVPLEADAFRCTPEGKLRVYRTSDAGASWKAMTDGLPQHDAYETVLRDAMSVDALAPAGVYFGTRSGKLFGSSDEGQTWTAIVDGLPPIVAVKTAIVS